MKRFAPLLIILAACLWGTMGLFVRHLNTMGLSAMEIVEVRSILAALILFPCTALKDRHLLKIRPKNLWPLAGSGIFSIVFFNFCYFSTIARMNLSAAAIFTLYCSYFCDAHESDPVPRNINHPKNISAVPGIPGLLSGQRHRLCHCLLVPERPFAWAGFRFWLRPLQHLLPLQSQPGP